MFTGGLTGGGRRRHAGPAGPRNLQSCWLQRASVHDSDVRGCVVPVVGALRGAVRKYLYIRACVHVCLLAHDSERTLARARACYSVLVCMIQRAARRSSGCRGAAPQALHPRPAVYHSNRAHAYWHSGCQLKSNASANSESNMAASMRVFIHGCFAVTGPSTVAEKL
jgi:hypothetical protein